MDMMGCISTADELSSKERLIAELSAMRFACANAIELNARYKALLRLVAYPRFGTEEMDMDREACAKLIASNFSLADLDG